MVSIINDLLFFKLFHPEVTKMGNIILVYYVGTGFGNFNAHG
jgi:hypothetical protein